MPVVPLQIESPPRFAVKERKPERSKELFKFAVWQVIAIVFVEFVLSLAGLGEEESFRFDPEIGFMHIPNKSITWRSEGFAHSYFNDDGMREPGLTISKPANVYRVAFIGDSMVESMHVPLEKTFEQLLSQKLTTELKNQYAEVQVLNFGSSGYSTAQEYMALKRKVFKYAPDMVIMGYNSRDMFENWSPPDSTLTNVRPFALYLPGHPLVIDSTPVKAWLRSPRGRFLSSIGWIREHSRIWGLIAAAEQEMSFHDPIYKAVMHFLTEPKKATAEFKSEWPKLLASLFERKPAFKIQSFESKQQQPSQQARDAKWVKDSTTAATEEKPAPVSKSLENYMTLMTNTMGALLKGMQDQCSEHHAKFAVVAMPCRGQLLPSPMTDSGANGITYNQEVFALNKLCQDENIPFMNTESEAAKLNKDRLGKIFFTAHLTPAGHELVTAVLYEPVLKQIEAKSK